MPKTKITLATIHAQIKQMARKEFDEIEAARLKQRIEDLEKRVAALESVQN